MTVREAITENPNYVKWCLANVKWFDLAPDARYLYDPEWWFRESEDAHKDNRLDVCQCGREPWVVRKEGPQGEFFHVFCVCGMAAVTDKEGIDPLVEIWNGESSWSEW
jgi:hypothetical protein